MKGTELSEACMGKTSIRSEHCRDTETYYYVLNTYNFVSDTHEHCSKPIFTVTPATSNIAGTAVVNAKWCFFTSINKHI